MLYFAMYSDTQQRHMADVAVLTQYESQPADQCPALVRWAGNNRSWVIWETLEAFSSVSMNPDMAHDQRRLMVQEQPAWMSTPELARMAELATRFFDEA